jgi:hypothetical protein
MLSRVGATMNTARLIGSRRKAMKPAGVRDSIWTKACACVDNAYEVLGIGWWHVSADVRWGLVAAEVLKIVLSQDEGVASTAVRNLAHDLEAAARMRFKCLAGMPESDHV